MVWDATAGLPLLLRGGNDYFVYGPGGLPIEQITSGAATYLHHDQLGSTRVLTNTKGEVGGTYRYGPNGAFWEHTGAAVTLMGFAGQYRMHTGSQLIYLRARTYDPVTAQFLSRDPLEAGSGEAYAYAADNPVNLLDPMGLLAEGCGCPPPPCSLKPEQPDGAAVGPSRPPKPEPTRGEQLVGSLMSETAKDGGIELAKLLKKGETINATNVDKLGKGMLGGFVTTWVAERFRVGGYERIAGWIDKLDDAIDASEIAALGRVGGGGFYYDPEMMRQLNQQIHEQMVADLVSRSGFYIHP